MFPVLISHVSHQRQFQGAEGRVKKAAMNSVRLNGFEVVVQKRYGDPEPVSQVAKGMANMFANESIKHSIIVRFSIPFLTVRVAPTGSRRTLPFQRSVRSRDPW